MAVIEQPVEVSERERLKTEALQWVNDVRTRRRAEPLAELPRGVMGSPGDCTLARATADLRGYGEVITVPRSVSEFVRRFDAGEYPELIAPELVVC